MGGNFLDSAKQDSLMWSSRLNTACQMIIAVGFGRYNSKSVLHRTSCESFRSFGTLESKDPTCGSRHDAAVTI